MTDFSALLLLAEKNPNQFVMALSKMTVEGITEFLPISSTGHLIIGSSLMGIASDPFVKAFTVAIQLGAIASVVDCVRMLDASDRAPDAERLVRLRRVMDLERQLVPSRGLYIER